MILLDTHVIIWLFEGKTEFFSKKCVTFINDTDILYVSPISLLEIDYLYEVKKILNSSAQIYSALSDEINLEVNDVSLRSLYETAKKESWTRDVFDRLLVSHSKIAKIPLITKDKDILKNYSQARW